MSKRERFISDALDAGVDDCILWPFAVRKSSGYPAHNVRIAPGVKRNVDAHRYVCELAHGKPEDGDEAAHSCGVKLCINPAHLSWADHLSNMADAKMHGTLRGGGRGRQRIFGGDIAHIRASSMSLSELAAIYGSDVSYMSRIRRAANG